MFVNLYTSGKGQGNYKTIRTGQVTNTGDLDAVRNGSSAFRLNNCFCQTIPSGVQREGSHNCCTGQDDVVLGFLTPPNAGTDGAPLKSLFAFERVHVKSGETISVSLYPQLTDFTHVRTHSSQTSPSATWRTADKLAATRDLCSVCCTHSALTLRFGCS